MMKEIFIKYKDNFDKFLIYIILSIIIVLITSSLDLPLIKSSSTDLAFDFKSLFSIDFLKITGISLIELYITAYGLVIIKEVTLDKPVDQKQALSEALSYYPRLLIINLIFIIIIIFFILILSASMAIIPNRLLLLFSNAIVFLVLITILLILMETTQNYLIYSDEGIGPSSKQGIKIAKKYFLKIFGLLLILFIIRGLSDLDIIKTDYIALTVGSVPTILFSIYFDLYIMNSCKRWGEVN